MTVTNYATGPDPLLVNLNWYESLPTDLRKTFDEVARDAIALSDQLNRAKEEEYIHRLSAKLAVNYVEGDSLQPFRDAVRPVYEHYVQRGDISWDEIQRAREAARGE
jgi:C4-dicarboxylate-binding protein DctP